MDSGSCRSDRLSNDILCSAGVSTRVFWVGVHDVQRDETKAVGLDEPRASFHRLVVMEPFDLHCRIGHGYQSALEVSSLTFLDLHVVQRSGENWGLSGCFFDVFSSLVFRSVLEIMNLFEAELVLRVS